MNAVPKPSPSRGVRLRFWLWSAAVLLLCAVFAVRVLPHPRLETDILALLPADHADPAADRALARFADQFGSHLVLLVGSDDFDRARGGAQALAAQLGRSPAFRKVRWKLGGDWLRRATATYAPYRDGLLSDRMRRWLQRGDTARLLAQARQALYTPAAFMRRSDAGSDPLDLFGDFLAQTTPAVTGHLDLRDDVLTTHDHGVHYVLVDAELSGKPFSATAGDAVGPVIDAALARARDHGLTVLASGIVLHAIAAAREARSQLDRFGLIQALGMIALLWWAFRSWRVPLLAVGTLAVGFVAAFTACQLVFDKVHVLTLVFGCNLAGVAIDYCLYFCADQFRTPGRWRPADALAQVGGAITLGMLISVVSYAVLATTPFPGLRQMALFCAVGLAVAWACVLCWYPRALRAAPAALAQRRATRFAVIDAALARGVARLPPPAWLLLGVLLLAVTALGLSRLRFQDDVRVLQDAPAALVKQDAAVGRLLGGDTDRRFFLVRGVDDEAVLEREEALRQRLDTAVHGGALGSYTAVTQALPSVRRQTSDRTLLAQRVYDGVDGPLASFMRQLGFSSAAITRRLQAFHAKARPLTLKQWLPSTAADPYRHLWLGAIGGDVASVVTLSNVHDAAAITAAAAGLPGVRLIDRVADVSAVLRAYRARTLWLAALAGVLATLLLATYFRRRSDLALAATPAAAAALTFAVFGLTGVEVNLFNVVALLLVLGLSVDYAIFTQRGRAQGLSMLLSVSLAAAATVLAFGLLALSPTPFIHSLGLTVLVGVALDFVLCLIVGKIGSPPGVPT